MAITKHPLDHSDVTVAELEAEYRKMEDLRRDKNRDGILDEFQETVDRETEDKDGNGLPDAYEAHFGNDRNGNGIPDDRENDEPEIC